MDSVAENAMIGGNVQNEVKLGGDLLAGACQGVLEAQHSDRLGATVV